MIDNQSIENLKQRLDIVDVVGSYLELKKNGANFKCICPFHNDSNPSLVISPSKQIYHCFSCQAGGDAIKFVMEYEKLNYPEAIEKLATMYNFSLTYTNENHVTHNSKLMQNLTMFFRQNLDKNNQAKAYITQRGIKESIMEKFELGFAGSSFETLNFLKNYNHSIDEAKEYGVADYSQNGSGQAYCRFVDRVMFPIRSKNGMIVGFGGRTISNHPAKYINSPQTKYFNKSRLLYGYYFAKDSIFKNKKIIITEGYLDVVMLHQAGFDNAVATLGTALTEEHLPLIAKLEPEVILAYDGDDAGINAALKASMLLSRHSFKGGVILFGGGLDPADMVKNNQIDKLTKLFSQAQPFVEFAIERIVKKYDLNDPIEKEKALHEGTQYLQSIPLAQQESYRGVLSGALNLPQNLIKLKRNQTHRDKRESFEDFLELTIIKTILHKPTLIDTLLDTIDIVMFKTHHTEFKLLLENKLDDARLRRIMLWDDIKIYEENDLFSAMITFLIRFYSEKLHHIKHDKLLNYKEKQFHIRSIQEKIFKLKKGELVAYEEDN
ncbi:DNA primase [Sulfurospirillum sp. 1612]|uniref:DNA primase n=1 Tax=Sulfurospirillum sp. 1612 TaxID=3094835 RepID=UPI002F95D95D